MLIGFDLKQYIFGFVLFLFKAHSSTSFNWQKPHWWAIKGQALAGAQSAENLPSIFPSLWCFQLSISVLVAAPIQSALCVPRLVFDLETCERGSKIRPGDSSIRLWLLFEKHNSALCRYDPRIPDWTLSRSACCQQPQLASPDGTRLRPALRRRKSATSPVSKEHAIILDIKHLAADPARVTQWAKEKSLHHK